jgi:hypothetical protein
LWCAYAVHISDKVKLIYIFEHRRSPMTSYTSPTRFSGITSWFRRAEGWLDARGRGAWICAMVLGFVLVWPLGVAVLAYITLTNRWSKSLIGQSSPGFGRNAAPFCAKHTAYRTSGNDAFDAYKAETLGRLEQEQAAFEGFLQRLREAKDKAQFDSFMENRAKANHPVDPNEKARLGEY